MDSSAAEALFARTFSGTPTAVGFGPGRVNLIGEHTDYNDGFALPMAIDHQVIAAVRLSDTRRIRMVTDFTAGMVDSSLDDLANATSLGWAAYPLGVVWALGEAGVDLSDVPGFDLALVSDVPVGAGLSSSAAIESAVAMALNALWDAHLDRLALAKIGQRAENVVVGAPTGIMDQSASLLGQQGYAVLLDCRSLATELIPFDLAAEGLRLLVLDTKTSHAHASGGYGSRRASCEQGAAALDVAALRDLGPADLPRAQALLDEVTYRRVRHVITENQRVLDTAEALREVGPRAIGEFMLASHESMRDDFEISTDELDVAVASAVAAGAIGARMTGGGFGGSAIALVPDEAIATVEAAVRAACAKAGFAAPEVYPVLPAAGARVEVRPG
jgi:galactokinase